MTGYLNMCLWLVISVRACDWLPQCSPVIGYLNAEEWGEEDVGEDDEVDLVEEAPEHEDHQDEIHNGEHAQRYVLKKQ